MFLHRLDILTWIHPLSQPHLSSSLVTLSCPLTPGNLLPQNSLLHGSWSTSAISTPKQNYVAVLDDELFELQEGCLVGFWSRWHRHLKACGHPFNRWWKSSCAHSFVTMGSRIYALVMDETVRRGRHTHFTHSIDLPAIMQWNKVMVFIGFWNIKVCLERLLSSIPWVSVSRSDLHSKSSRVR